MWQNEIKIQSARRGLHPITAHVRQALPDLPEIGMLNLFLLHTSASLVIQENADPTAREDLENFLNRLCPDDQSWHEHTVEGPDDTTSHMKSSLTATSLNVPIRDSALCLGTWQGIYLWEHRESTPARRLVLTLWP
jgi:secondary thiamine-phosphate synthase enzyme